MAYDEYSLLMKDPQPAQWRADELFGKSTSSGRRSGSTSSSFLPNLSWTPPGTADPVLDVATAVVDALGEIDNSPGIWSYITRRRCPQGYPHANNNQM